MFDLNYLEHDFELYNINFINSGIYPNYKCKKKCNVEINYMPPNETIIPYLVIINSTSYELNSTCDEIVIKNIIE